MTPKQYQRELWEIMRQLVTEIITCDDFGNVPTMQAIDAILALNERALPKEKSTYIKKGVWQPTITDEMKMGFNSAISDIRQIIGKGK